MEKKEKKIKKDDRKKIRFGYPNLNNIKKVKKKKKKRRKTVERNHSEEEKNRKANLKYFKID